MMDKMTTYEWMRGSFCMAAYDLTRYLFGNINLEYYISQPQTKQDCRKRRTRNQTSIYRRKRTWK
jgi:hypothetical protein